MRKLIVLLVVAASMISAATAFGADSTVLGGYGSNAAKPVSAVKGTAATDPAAQESTLPFTGADLTVVLVAGLGLLGLGVAMRKLGRQKE